MKTEAQMLKLRLSGGLKDWLRDQARQNCRTMTAEVIFRLEVARLGLQQVTGSSGEAAAGEPSRA